MTVSLLHVVHDGGMADVIVDGRFTAGELIDELIELLDLDAGPWRLVDSNILDPTTPLHGRWLDGTTILLTQRSHPHPAPSLTTPHLVSLDHPRGTLIALPPFETIIGSADDCDINVADAEPHHAAIDGTPSGQIACRVPFIARPIDGRVDVNAVPIDHPTAIRPGDIVTIAGRRWTLTVPAAERRLGTSHLAVPRPPRVELDDPRAPLDLPPVPDLPHRVAAPWITLAVTIGLMAVMVPYLDGSLIAVYAFTPVLIAAGWCEARWSRRRDVANLVEADQSQLDAIAFEVSARRTAWAAWDRWTHPPLDDLVDQVGTLGTRLWERGRDDADRLVVRLGRTTVTGTISEATVALVAQWAVGPTVKRDPFVTLRDQRRHLVESEQLNDAALTIDLAEGSVAFVGPDHCVDSLTRAVVIQLAALRSPTSLTFATPPPSHRWTYWLPHNRRTHGPGPHNVVRGATDDAPDARHDQVMIVDARRFDVERATAVAATLPADSVVIWLAADPRSVPRSVHHVVTIARDGTRLTVRSGRTYRRDGIPEGLTAADVHRIARRLAPCRDVIDGDPHSNLWDTLDPGSTAIEQRWGDRRTNPLDIALPIARLGGDSYSINLVDDGPHGLVAGTTGSGKSVLLVSLILAAATQVSPRDLRLVLIDFKGGAAFGPLVDLPHTAATITNLDDGSLDRMTAGIDAEISRRMATIATTGSADIDQHNRRLPPDDPRRLGSMLIVVDEFAALVADHPEVIDTMTSATQRGRSLGVHLVLATQRPTGVVTPAIAANTALRICLRTLDPSDALDVVGSTLPSRFDPDRPGTALVGTDQVQILGTSTLRTDRRVRLLDGRPAALEQQTDTVRAIVATIVDAWATISEPLPPPPWGPLLPTEFVIDPPQTRNCIGLVDRPTEPEPDELLWSGDHMLVIGPDHDRQAVLDGLAAVALNDASVMIIGSPDDGRPAPCCAASDIERLRRLPSDPPRVLVIDDVGTVNDLWDDPRRSDWWDRMLMIVRSGAVTVIVGARGRHDVPASWRDLLTAQYELAAEPKGRAHDTAGRVVQFGHLPAGSRATGADHLSERRLPDHVVATADHRGWRVGIDDETLDDWIWDGTVPLVVAARRRRHARDLVEGFALARRVERIIDLTDDVSDGDGDGDLSNTIVMVDIDTGAGYSPIARELRREAMWLVVRADDVDEIGLGRVSERARLESDPTLSALITPTGAVRLGRATSERDRGPDQSSEPLCTPTQ